MLGSAVVPATASTYTSPSTATSITSASTSPRPSRLRGLSYLRSYTHNHLRSDAPPLTRTTSSPGASPPQTASEGLQNSESGWLPTVTSTTSTTRESAAPEPNLSNNSMTRSRAATVIGPTPTMSSLRQHPANENDPPPASSSTPASAPTERTAKDELPTIRFIPHVETRSTRPSLHFTTMSRTLRTPTSVVRVGRYSERDNNNSTTPSSSSHNPGNPAGTPASTAHLPVGFKSKVVSRRHCEFWCGANQQWYIKDVKSSSGTFLNHVRLSPPGQESRPFEVSDGDTVQLGIDFKGGEEVIFRCVKIRVECNRGWQKSLNAYNTTAHKRLLKNAGVASRSAKGGKGGARDSDAASVNSSSECSICLNAVAPCQALFVAPCSHVWHYKCVRNLIHSASYPNFLCPNCRFVADLEADVEPPEEPDFEEAEEEEAEAEAVGAEREVGVGAEGERRDGQGVGEGGEEDGRSTPRPLQPGLINPATDEELADLLQNTSLQPGVHQTPHHLSFSPSTTDSVSSPQHSSSTTTQPIDIQQPQQPESSLLGARSTTPTSSTQFALASGILMPDGPLTPRNDAGPFVLDGSAGRSRPVSVPVGGFLERVVSEEEGEREGER